MLFKSGYILKGSTSNTCTKSQDIQFLQNENINCVLEFETGPTCALSDYIDPTKLLDSISL
jgi:hypothetical protein